MTASDIAFAQTHRAGKPGLRLRPVIAGLRLAFRRYAQRRALAAMEPWQLDDLGLTRAEADAEACRPPWEGRSKQSYVGPIRSTTAADGAAASSPTV